MKHHITPENRALLVEKIILLEKYLGELRGLGNVSFEEYEANSILRRGTERLLQLIVEVASDINSTILAHRHLKPPSSYYDSFTRLAHEGIMDRRVVKDMARTTGLRNRLVHEYGEYKDIIVHRNIRTFLDLYGHYLQTIKLYIRKV